MICRTKVIIQLGVTGGLYTQKMINEARKYDLVAPQMYEHSDTENPPNCVGGIRELIYYLLIVSLLLALNTSRSFTLLRIICLVSTVVTHS